MRLASILLSIIMLSWFSAYAQVNIFGLNMTVPEPLSSEPNMAVPEPLSSEPNMAVPEPLVSKPNMDMPTPLTPKPNMDMPKPNPKPPIVPNANINQTSNISSNETQMFQRQQKEPLNVSGKWSIKLNGSTDGSLDLRLWSDSGVNILGSGTLTEGSIRNSVTASGSASAQELTLTTRSAVPEFDRQYILELFMVNNTLSGTYTMKSGGQSLGKGNATAVKQ